MFIPFRLWGTSRNRRLTYIAAAVTHAFRKSDTKESGRPCYLRRMA